MEPSLDQLIPFDANDEQPVTPHPPNATIDGVTGPDGTKPQSTHGDAIATSMTPPPSTQANVSRSKDRTPTPTYSSISTPPPTIDILSDHQSKLTTAVAATLSDEQIASASADELRTAVGELQAAYQEAKMNAAHYKLQYQMLAQESEAAMERMDVEARMAQHENDIIQIAGQARAAAVATPTPIHPSPASDGMILVQRDLYQYMCLEIQHLNKTAEALQRDNAKQDRLIVQQEAEIETLSDRVALLRDRIRSNREHLNHLRRPVNAPESDFSHSNFNTPRRAKVPGQDQFAALLQASEIARKEANPSRKSSHSKSVPVSHPHATMTPQRYQKHPTIYATPGQAKTSTTPATAAVSGRVASFRAPDSYQQHQSHTISQLPTAGSKSTLRRPSAARSEETVSNSDRDIDSEAETEIIEPDGPVSESQASIKASLMLRTSHDDDLTEHMAASRAGKAKSQPKQTTLFGAVRKHGIDRHDGDRPNKRSRNGDAGGVGLGIMGARH